MKGSRSKSREVMLWLHVLSGTLETVQNKLHEELGSEEGFSLQPQLSDQHSSCMIKI